MGLGARLRADRNEDVMWGRHRDRRTGMRLPRIGLGMG